VTWQAHGALQILRAAYAATYRQMLAINHKLEAYRRPGHSSSNAPGGRLGNSEEARDDQGWPFSADPINLYQGRIAPL
jgi:hypothetical protein